jgi:peptide/nickel transport system ATP-binding protein
MKQPLLSVANLTVVTDEKNGSKTILDDVSFELNSGQILSVIGESGAGKTVLAKTIVSWLPTTLSVASGQIIFRGKDLIDDPKSASKLAGRDIAYVGGNPAGALDPTMTVGAQLVEKLTSVCPQVSSIDAKRRAIELLEAVRIPAANRRFDEYPMQYSGGMMQRVMIVDALLSEPALLVADNITQPLDVTVAAQILKLMRELNHEFNTAILFICSSLPVACDASDSVLVLNKGKVVELQSPKNLVSEPAHHYTQALIKELPKLWDD